MKPCELFPLFDEVDGNTGCCSRWRWIFVQWSICQTSENDERHLANLDAQRNTLTGEIILWAKLS